MLGMPGMLACLSANAELLICSDGAAGVETVQEGVERMQAAAWHAVATVLCAQDWACKHHAMEEKGVTRLWPSMRTYMQRVW